jgi:hypothetical protein
MPTVVLKSLSCSQHSELLLLLQHYLFPLLLKTLSEHSAFPLALCGTRVVLLLLKQFPSEFETEAEVIPTALRSPVHKHTGKAKPFYWLFKTGASFCILSTATVPTFPFPIF